MHSIRGMSADGSAKGREAAARAPAEFIDAVLLLAAALVLLLSASRDYGRRGSGAFGLNASDVFVFRDASGSGGDSVSRT